MPMTRADYTGLALLWAKERWCWIDDSAIEELVDDHAPFDQRPDTFSDEQATDADLDDPTEGWGSFSGPKHAARIEAVRDLIATKWRRA